MLRCSAQRVELKIVSRLLIAIGFSDDVGFEFGLLPDSSVKILNPIMSHAYLYEIGVLYILNLDHQML